VQVCFVGDHIPVLIASVLLAILVLGYPVFLIVMSVRWKRKHHVPLIVHYMVEEVSEDYKEESYWAGMYFNITVCAVSG